MYKKQLTKKIKRRKMILNLLLKYLSPTNKLMIKLSTDLDKLVYIYQKNLYKRYRKRNQYFQYKKISA
ncbi:MAG TPA: hypothetical protein VIK26_08085 [Clostridium sp.]